jgi:hypothetical protein
MKMYSAILLLTGLAACTSNPVANTVAWEELRPEQ